MAARAAGLMAEGKKHGELAAKARDLPSWDLTPRQICDLELLLSGALGPLSGFMVKKDYRKVCQDMQLAGGKLWPLPVTLDVDEKCAKGLKKGAALALRDLEGAALAVVEIAEVFRPEKKWEAGLVYDTDDPKHPAVDHLMNRSGEFYVGGKVIGLARPGHYDFGDVRLWPGEIKEEFRRRGWRKVLAFQTHQYMHRAEFEATFREARKLQANLLIHPAVGPSSPEDVDHYSRVRAYQALLPRYPKNTAVLNLLPFATRWAGPREALMCAMIHKNYGCTHFMLREDYQGPELRVSSRENVAYEQLYKPGEAGELLKKHEQEIGIKIVPFGRMVYLEDQDKFVPEDRVPNYAQGRRIGHRKIEKLLEEEGEVPQWCSFPEVMEEMKKAHPPRHRKGFTLFFTGLSGAGKSTLANVVRIKLLEIGGRPVTLLDGDIVRKNLSSELGFSREHRNINIRRIGFVASEITKNGGIAICAPIAPYDSVRREVREMIEKRGGFILVHVSTPLEVCEQRDRKGMYAKARAGIVKEFTGISDPYEEPGDAEVAVDTSDVTPQEAAQGVLLYLESKGYIGAQR